MRKPTSLAIPLLLALGVQFADGGPSQSLAPVSVAAAGEIDQPEGLNDPTRLHDEDHLAKVFDTFVKGRWCGF